MLAHWSWRCLFLVIYASLMLSFVFLLQPDWIQGPRVPSKKMLGLLDKTLSTENQTPLYSEVEARQQERKRRLTDFCDHHNLSSKRPLQLTHLRFVRPLIGKERRLLYCAIPKAGSTQWRINLARAEGRTDNNFVRGSPKAFWFEGLPRPEISRKLQALFKFVIVRDPFTRLLSAYRNKFFYHPKFWFARIKVSGKIFHAFRGNTSSHHGDVTFKEFLDYVTLLSGYKENVHWMSYEDLCLPCDIDYDFIGHLETIHEECQYILEKAGIANLTSCPKRQVSTNTTEIKKFYAEISRETILKIRKIFKNDFEMHGYPFPGVLEFRVKRFTWDEVWNQKIP